MVQTHQKAQYLLYLTSFVVNEHRKGTYFDTFEPSYGQKASNGTVFAVFDINCAHCV